MILLEIVFPVFVVIAIGYVSKKYVEFSISSLSFLTIYVFSPALYFNAIIKSEIQLSEVLQIVFFVTLLTLIMTIIIRGFSLVSKLEKDLEKSMLLSVLFPNVGNYGLPIILYAFGPQGFAVGVIYTVVESFKQNTLGIYFAANAHIDLKHSLITIFKMPGFWAVAVGIALRSIGLMPPTALLRPVELMAEAALPLAVFTLGCQLVGVNTVKNSTFVLSAVFFRLVLTPLCGVLLLLWLFDLNSLTGKVMLIQAACPVAVMITMIAHRFETRPDLVSSATFLSTLLSLLTIPLVLYFIL